MKQPSRNALHKFVLFSMSFSILLFEILLTRYSSVILWNQLVFVAVSVGLFGISLGAVWAFFSEKRNPSLSSLAWLCFLFSVSLLASTALYFLTPISVFSLKHTGLVLLVSFFLFFWPFFFGGAVISSILNQRKDAIGSYYAFDLAGGSLACVLFVALLKITSAENLIFLIAAIGLLNARLLTADSAPKQRLLFSILALSALLAFGAGENFHGFRIRYAKGHQEKPGRHVEWNAFSRISVAGALSSLDPEIDRVGTDPSFRKKIPEQVFMEIDSFVAMPITRFEEHRLEDLDFLKQNVTSLAYLLKKNPSVYLIGPGGGRDVLAALAFHSRKIKAIELNPNIVKIVRKRFGSFSGGIYDGWDPVETIISEGRSYLARHNDRYDIVNALLVDTWASSMSGSLSLTENHLYTLEAFSEYLKKLEPDGLITVSRWIQNPPRQMLRIAVLGHFALKKIFPESNPLRHLFIAGVASPDNPEQVLGTCLIKKSPFTDEEIRTLENYCQENHFSVYYSPSGIQQRGFVEWNTADIQNYIEQYPYDISPPTDDRPFFFMTLKPRNFPAHLRVQDKTDDIKWLSNVLLFLMASLAVFAAIVLVFCLKHHPIKPALFFSGIGVGFILIENVLIAAFNVFLGYPTYSLIVVLFSLLFFAGLGSLSADRTGIYRNLSRFKKIISGLCLLLLVFALSHRVILGFLYFLPNAVKILFTLIFVGAVGFMLGHAFPVGTHVFCREKKYLFPWVWAINGAASVAGSALAVCLSLCFGFSFCIGLGIVCYLLILLCL